ncbi:MAG TPA: cupin domain-containing protein [Candidatus Ventricola intestinavium]|nr:cupin domain-containing protein [Candidatus Ventricola intestinavium]
MQNRRPRGEECDRRVNIGEKLRNLRQRNNLTQKELADRCELSKGFISQLESNQTSPSLSTLEDILTALGSSFHEFFSDEQGDNPVCRKEDVFIKETEGGVTIHWLIPNAQKKDIEPILVTISPGAQTEPDLPHMGEEFGHVLSGAVTLMLGEKAYRVRKGDSFSYKPTTRHYLENTGKTPATVIWVCTPPNF